MKVVRTLRTSIRALLAHRTRSVLAAGGVTVGIAAALLTAAIGAGARAAVLRELSSTGMQVLTVRPAQAKRSAARPGIQGAATSFTLEDCLAIGDASAVAAAVPVVQGRRGVRSDAGSLTVSVLGTTREFVRVRNFELGAGRFFDGEEDAASARVAVLGARVGERLFEGNDPVGRPVRIDGVPFEVIGVLRPKGLSFEGADQDSGVYVPLQTARRRVFNQQWLTMVFVELADGRPVSSTANELRELLRERHRIARRGSTDDFEVQDPAKLLALRAEATRTLSIVSSGLGAISLLVGGTGILALMLLSVRERTGEIGLRRALGARTTDILLQFLAEATALALSGGLSGMVLGALGVWIVSATTGWEARVSLQEALVSLGAAAGIGLAFGVVPAVRAARLTPIQALGRE
ncbi:MAG TPA: ABC transporter permease [Anaeromyxobacter sp.]